MYDVIYAEITLKLEMDWRDISVIIATILLANYHAAKGQLSFPRFWGYFFTIFLYLFGIFIVVSVLNITNKFPTEANMPEWRNVLNLLWYTLARPSGAGIIIYGIGLCGVLILTKIKLRSAITGFQTPTGRILWCAIFGFVQCLFITGSAYFLFSMAYSPPPPNDSSILSKYLFSLTSPLRTANKYDYWMFGYMSRDRQLPPKELREIHRIASSNEEETAKKLVYWVGSKIKYDPTTLRLIQPLFPGFNFPITKVLEEGKGTSLEYARLYHAAALQAGIRSRVVIGTAQRGNDFVEHCWNEVYIDETWVSVDPTWSNTTENIQILMPGETGYIGPKNEYGLLRSALPEEAQLEHVKGMLLFGIFDKSKYISYAKYPE